MIKKRKYSDKWILAIKSYSNVSADKYLDIVFCYLPHNKITPYVTWIYNHSDGGFHEGHYFNLINKAILDFLIRGKKAVRFNDDWIKQHDAIETHYVRYLKEHSCWEECNAEDAQMISVYLHKPEGGIECISDHYDPKDAMRIVRWISNQYELPIQYQPKDVHYTKLQPIIK